MINNNNIIIIYIKTFNYSILGVIYDDNYLHTNEIINESMMRRNMTTDKYLTQHSSI